MFDLSKYSIDDLEVIKGIFEGKYEVQKKDGELVAVPRNKQREEAEE